MVAYAAPLHGHSGAHRAKVPVYKINENKS